FFFFQAEDGIRDFHVTGFRRVLFRSSRRASPSSRPGALLSRAPRTILARARSSETARAPRLRASPAQYPSPPATSSTTCPARSGPRSEERRVGKGRGSGGSAGDDTTD